MAITGTSGVWQGTVQCCPGLETPVVALLLKAFFVRFLEIAAIPVK